MTKAKLSPEDMLARLAFYRNHEKFPDADWIQQELPLPNEVLRQKMNDTVNAFIDFLMGLLNDGDTEPEEFKDSIQAYIDVWDVTHFSTDEIDFIISVECSVMRVVNVNCSDLAL